MIPISAKPTVLGSLDFGPIPVWLSVMTFPKGQHRACHPMGGCGVFPRSQAAPRLLRVRNPTFNLRFGHSLVRSLLAFGIDGRDSDRDDEPGAQQPNTSPVIGVDHSWWTYLQNDKRPMGVRGCHYPQQRPILEYFSSVTIPFCEAGLPDSKSRRPIAEVISFSGLPLTSGRLPAISTTRASISRSFPAGTSMLPGKLVSIETLSAPVSTPSVSVTLTLDDYIDPLRRLTVPKPKVKDGILQ